MAKSIKISPINKEYGSTFLSLEGSLARHNMARSPGTGRVFLPYKDKTDLYRTGFELNSPFMEKLKQISKEQYDAEVLVRTEAKNRLSKAIGCPTCLEPNSPFYNFAYLGDEIIGSKKVNAVKLGNSDFMLDLNDPWAEITWFWLKSHPLIAPSLEAYRRGEVPAETQYYVADSDAETKLVYTKKKEINDALAKLNKLTPTDKRRIARLMALPVGIGELTPEEEVYNILDSALKEVEFKGGKYKGMSTVRLFTEISNLSAEKLKARDIIEQAISKNIYRVRANGKIFEGENEVAKSVSDLIEFMMDDAHQEDYLILEKKLISKIAVEF